MYGAGCARGSTEQRLGSVGRMIMNDTVTIDMKPLTIIGVGSSAGGLEAIRELVSSVPNDMHVSYVVVQHMSPHHKSLMTELVARETNLSVVDVEDGITPEPNVIYITPPKADVLYEDGMLRLVEPSPEVASPKPSVDRFLLSLADSHGEHSMAIILSGTGTDGAYGVQAIREAGGITIAQGSDSAKYDGMPTAAVQTGCIDLILHPQEIGTHLQKILSSPRDFDELRRGELVRSPVSDLLQILLARTRVDFRDYKQTTINRRIERRMVALGIESKEEYTQFCRTNPQAVDALFKDLLISVTRFFRDRQEFEELNNFIPDLVERANGTPIRVWVAGCATGEEAYSIAMLLAEALGGPQVPLKNHVQIFATDIDEDALRMARRGFYGLAALNDIPADLADKYLLREKDGVRVIDNLRTAILFSHHNVCQDPPFQKIGLLCCRNLLIYFGNALQQKVMGRFHYALTETGLMFLGTAESVAGSEQLFVQDSRAAHIYRRRAIKAETAPTPKRSRYGEPLRPLVSDPNASSAGHSTDRRMFEALMKSLGANSVLVTDDYSIVRINGNVSPYINMTDQSTLKMHLDLLRSPLREEARSLTTLALKHDQPRQGVRHLLNADGDNEVRLDVYPIVAKEINERAALVVFTALAPARKDGELTRDGEGSSPEVDRIRSLETEVANTREALQQTIEELETSNEELQSLNEEMQSTNEELQATNEELETSNEELQSTNEELITVNEELQVTASELNERTSELSSILESAPIAILVLDSALQISQASGSAVDLFKLNRPLSSPHISQCTLPSGFPPLAPICSETLRLGEKISNDFTSRSALVQITTSPFFDGRGQIQGVTMVVTTFPSLAAEMELILNSSNFFIMNREFDGTIRRISHESASLLGLGRKEAEGGNIYEYLDQETGADLRNGDESLLSSEAAQKHDIVELKSKAGKGSRWLSMHRLLMHRDESEHPSIYAVGVDVTDALIARQAAEEAFEQLSLIQEMSGIGYWMLDLEREHVTWSDEVYRIHGVARDDFNPTLDNAIDFYHPDDRDAVRDAIAQAATEGGRFKFALRLVRPDGETVSVEAWGQGRAGKAGQVRHIVGAFREVVAETQPA